MTPQEERKERIEKIVQWALSTPLDDPHHATTAVFYIGVLVGELETLRVEIHHLRQRIEGFMAAYE